MRLKRWATARGRAASLRHVERIMEDRRNIFSAVCTENVIRVDAVMESPKLAE
jgi:hypothetical protein